MIISVSGGDVGAGAGCGSTCSRRDAAADDDCDAFGGIDRDWDCDSQPARSSDRSRLSSSPFSSFFLFLNPFKRLRSVCVLFPHIMSGDVEVGFRQDGQGLVCYLFG